MKLKDCDKEFYELGYEKCQSYLLRLGGMYVKKDKSINLNRAYVSFYLGYFIMLLIFLGPYSVSRSIPEGNQFSTFQILHFYVVIFGYSGASIMYHMNSKFIDSSLITVGKGFYTYAREEHDGEVLSIVREDYKNLKKFTKYILAVGCFVGIFVLLITPLVELVLKGFELTEETTVNPFLPVPLYTPWRQDTITGYLSAYLAVTITTVFIILELLALSLGYSSFMVVYIAQFKILNASIIRLEDRATKLYWRYKRTGYFEKDKFADPFFQRCMHFCLKQNIKHHQVLLSWLKEVQKFIGWALLCTFLATSVLLATTGYTFTFEARIIWERIIERNDTPLQMKHRAHDSITGIVMLTQVQVMELIHSFQFCWWGENLSIESAKILMSLYSTPWFNCDNSFKKIVHIMLTNSIKPVVPQDPIFKLKASLELYGSIISTAYTYFNLIRSGNAE